MRLALSELTSGAVADRRRRQPQPAALLTLLEVDDPIVDFLQDGDARGGMAPHGGSTRCAELWKASGATRCCRNMKACATADEFSVVSKVSFSQ
jgi:hypothetical protein